MKIFLAGIIQGSMVEPKIHNQDWRDAIKQVLARHLPTADVYCHYTQHPHSILYDLPRLKAVLEEGNRRAAECDLLVAFLPAASMGTAIEMHEAAAHGGMVLTISPLAANWVVRAYSDRVFPDIEGLEAFLSSGQFQSLLAQKAAVRAQHRPGT
jgi:hypothetical protein